MKVDLIVGAAKEFASLFNNLIEQGKLRNFKNLNKFIRLLEDEKVRPDRDHDDVIVWTRNVKIFTDTVIKEIKDGKK